jgi:hypothetical protein
MCMAAINHKLKTMEIYVEIPSPHDIMALTTVRVLRISGSARLPGSLLSTVIMDARVPTKEYYRPFIAHVLYCTSFQNTKICRIVASVRHILVCSATWGCARVFPHGIG